MTYANTMTRTNLDRESALIMRWNTTWEEFDALREFAHAIIPTWAQPILACTELGATQDLIDEVEALPEGMRDRAIDCWCDAREILDTVLARLYDAEDAGQFPPRGELTQARQRLIEVWA